MNIWGSMPYWEYPLEALPDLARGAAYELAERLKVAPSIIAMSIVTAMTAVVQDRWDTQLPNGKRSPTSLNLETLAESGSGKTPVDHEVFKPLHAHDKVLKEEYQKADAAYQLQMRIWETENKALLRKLRTCIERGLMADETRHALMVHEQKKPAKPRLRQIVYQNVSEAGLYEALDGRGESMVILSDEAGDLMKSELMTKVALLNALWSGAEALPVNRANGKSLHLHQPRLAISLMMQPEVFDKYMERHGEVIRATGHFARYLFARPPSTKGWRMMSSDSDTYVWVHLPKFHKRIEELLAERSARYASGHLEPEVLTFSPEAKELWRALHDANEMMMRPDGLLAEVSDYGSKLMEIMGRVAAVMHAFAGLPGPISRDTLKRASTVMYWHTQQYLKLFGPVHRPPQAQQDAGDVVRYLQRRWGCNWASRRDVYHCGPVRDRDRFAAALVLLHAQGHLLVQYGKIRRCLIALNPVYYGQGMVA